MSLRSMTGYGRGVAEATSDGVGLGVTVEIRSVNHRYLDVRVAVPRGLMALEPTVLAEVKERVGRGRVEVHVRVEGSRGAGGVVPDLDAALAVVNAMHEVSDALSLQRLSSTADIVPMAGRFLVAEEGPGVDDVGPVLSIALKDALDALLEARATEGAGLCEDLRGLAGELVATADAIERRAPDVVEEARRRLHERVGALLEGAAAKVDGDRLEHELALLADRTDVHEELQRLRHHASSLVEVLDAPPAEPIGRRLDFLAQELNREANTIGSKIADPAVTSLVVDMKATIERVREQVQNVE